MSIIRVKKDAKYFTASNEPFNDKRLSWEARGLMGYLLSKPNNWQVRMDALDKAGTAGNYKIRRMLAELRKYGYMNRIRVTVEGGKFDWITEVYESPSQNPKPSQSVQKRTSVRKSASGSSASGKLPDIVNTDSQSTDVPEGNGLPPTPPETPKPLKANQIPEVVLFRSVTKRYPPSVNNDDVVSSVQKVKVRLGREVLADDLLSFYKSWTAKGYNPNSLAWLEWAESGQVPQNGNWKSQKYTTEPKGFDAARKFLERQGFVNG